jgi:hypothetical protein
MNITSHNLWINLARHQGNKLVPQKLDCSKQNIIKLCKKLGLTIDQFKEWSGFQTIDKFQERNPNLKLFELQGQLLELIYEDEINEGIFE